MSTHQISPQDHYGVLHVHESPQPGTSARVPGFPFSCFEAGSARWSRPLVTAATRPPVRSRPRAVVATRYICCVSVRASARNAALALTCLPGGLQLLVAKAGAPLQRCLRCYASPRPAHPCTAQHSTSPAQIDSDPLGTPRCMPRRIRPSPRTRSRPTTRTGGGGTPKWDPPPPVRVRDLLLGSECRVDGLPQTIVCLAERGPVAVLHRLVSVLERLLHVAQSRIKRGIRTGLS